MSPAGMPAASTVAPTASPAAVPSYNAAYGGFWIRFVAFLIDAVVLGIVLVPVRLAFAGIGLTVLHGRMDPGDLARFFVIVPAIQSVFIGANWLYEALLLSSPWQATLGKKALGLKVTDEFGNRITFLRATGRHFAKWISFMVLCIGFIMIGFTDRKRGLPDMIAGTLVMKDLRY
jgi:uncharacterized RDD family membrane protein YckC